MSSSINDLPAPSPPSVAVQKAFVGGDINEALAFLYLLGMFFPDSGGI